mmetsp:Transcript_92856/g.203291  ORF Transcript_92856/g.203291 Transcript_92856/m.203291 type:complete len:205 (-) Transcript_92856:263-877(-)
MTSLTRTTRRIGRGKRTNSSSSSSRSSSNNNRGRLGMPPRRGTRPGPAAAPEVAQEASRTPGEASRISSRRAAGAATTGVARRTRRTNGKVIKNGMTRTGRRTVGTTGSLVVARGTSGRTSLGIRTRSGTARRTRSGVSQPVVALGMITRARALCLRLLPSPLSALPQAPSLRPPHRPRAGTSRPWLLRTESSLAVEAPLPGRR